MGPDHQPVNRQGSRGPREPGTRTGRAARAWPGLANLGRALAAAGTAKASREDHNLRRWSLARAPAGHRRSPGEACSRTTTSRHRSGQRRWPGLSTDRGLGAPAMCSHRLPSVGGRGDQPVLRASGMAPMLASSRAYRRISHTAARSVVTLRGGVRRLRSSCPHRSRRRFLIEMSQATFRRQVI